MYTKNIKISKCLTDLSDQQIQQMTKIVINYFPDPKLMECVIRNHMKQANTVCLALYGDEIIGFSIASKYKMITPFYHRPVNVIYQRMLYLDPSIVGRGIHFQLLLATMRDLLGWLWPCKRIVAFCRTQNPIVAKLMNWYNVSYPQYNQAIPEAIRKFAESLLPILDAESLDKKFRLTGTLRIFRGVDYTNKWNQYFHIENNNYEKLMLKSAFEEKDGCVINSGALILMIAYAKPFNFIRYLLNYELKMANKFLPLSRSFGKAPKRLK